MLPVLQLKTKTTGPKEKLEDDINSEKPYLKQTSNNGCSLNLHLVHPNPFLSYRLGRVLYFKSDLSLRISFLISNKGNVSSIYKNGKSKNGN